MPPQWLWSDRFEGVVRVYGLCMKPSSWLVSLASNCSGTYTVLDYADDAQATARPLLISILFLWTLLIVAFVQNMMVEVVAGDPL